jgi:hypothetical protein
MMSLITQASRLQFVQQNFSACMRMQGGLPPTMPRVVVRDQRSMKQIKRPSRRNLEQLAKKIIPQKLADARKIPSTSNVNSPSKTIYIPEEELSKFAISKTFDGSPLQFPVGASGRDQYEPGQVKFRFESQAMSLLNMLKEQTMTCVILSIYGYL